MKGFTLVELVIVIAIVIVLSVVSVPIYRSYVDKAKYSEGYALLGTILSAQKAYYSEYGNFLQYTEEGDIFFTNYDAILGVDARGNKYFTWFRPSGVAGCNLKFSFKSEVMPPNEYKNSNYEMRLHFNITKGVKITYNEPWDNEWLN